MKASLLLSLVSTIAMVLVFAAPVFGAEVTKKGVDIEVGGVGEGSASVSTSIAVENPVASIDKTLTLSQSGPGYKSAREGSTQTEINQDIFTDYYDTIAIIQTTTVTLYQYELKGYVEVKKDGYAFSEARVYGTAYADYGYDYYDFWADVYAATEISATAQTSSDYGLAKAYAYAMGDIAADAEVLWYYTLDGGQLCLTEAESDSFGKAVAKAVSVRDNYSSSTSTIYSVAGPGDTYPSHSYYVDTSNSYAEMTVSQLSYNYAKNAIGETYGEVNGLTKAMATETCDHYRRLIASEAKAEGLVKAGIQIKNPGSAIIDGKDTTGIRAGSDAEYAPDWTGPWYDEYWEEWYYWYGVWTETDAYIVSDLNAYGDDPRFRAKVWSLVKDAEAESGGTVAVAGDDLADVDVTSLEQATLIGKIVGKGAIDAYSYADVYTYGCAGDEYYYWEDYYDYYYTGPFAYSYSESDTYADDDAGKSFILAQVIQADAMTLAETDQTGTFALTEIEGVNIDTVEVKGNYSSELDYFGFVYNPNGYEDEGDDYIYVWAWEPYPYWWY